MTLQEPLLIHGVKIEPLFTVPQGFNDVNGLTDNYNLIPHLFKLMRYLHEHKITGVKLQEYCIAPDTVNLPEKTIALDGYTNTSKIDLSEPYTGAMSIKEKEYYLHYELNRGEPIFDYPLLYTFEALKLVGLSDMYGEHGVSNFLNFGLVKIEDKWYLGLLELYRVTLFQFTTATNTDLSYDFRPTQVNKNQFQVSEDEIFNLTFDSKELDTSPYNLAMLERKINDEAGYGVAIPYNERNNSLLVDRLSTLCNLNKIWLDRGGDRMGW